VTFDGQDWRGAPETARQMFRVFPIVRDLHELLWYVSEALTLSAASPLHDDLRAALEETERHTRCSPDALVELDVAAHRRSVNNLLLEASELARAGIKHKQDHRGADLVGVDLKGVDLRGAGLRGACLIGADLRRADLRVADVTGADFRGADIKGADLTGILFMIQSQLDAARGDAATRLPPQLTRPAHW
jgi:uncharacterized protein YjbI with pentapeptide repeats